jgi:hypothetical protein
VWQKKDLVVVRDMRAVAWQRREAAKAASLMSGPRPIGFKPTQPSQNRSNEVEFKFETCSNFF